MKKQLLTMAATAGLLFTTFNGEASAHENRYKVQLGDTLWRISINNNLSVEELKKWNNISGSTIYTGQSLSLLAPHSHEASTGTSSSGAVSYTVKSGDTLWGIARTHGLSVSALKNLNGLSRDTIYPGQKLKVKGTSQSVSVPAATASSGSSSVYTIQRGDTLSGIASRHNLSVSQLKAMNNLSSNLIYAGQTLKVKGTSVSQTTETKVAAQTASQVDELIAEAKKYMSVPYVWAGSTPSGFDCSGYLNYVYSNVGISIPRTVASIWSATRSVSTPRAGDLVFFETYKAGPSHAGIYLGNNKFIHAGSSRGVEISDMNNSYWKPRYLGARTTF
ncbi:peptidoglycan endopeptidase LytE [Aeromicrobium ponti]|uniref:D-gamma-glutamyl-meso-diaminopimelic acid endopeptidase CwlS/peptidoglycan endopeptidase LytE n=1 Tax=Cytobacillus oceanisediminis TaxID=665099 RepID=A0A562JCA3_9BACI|nr:peptidoglycan endopeptidase [Cytobacillus oceanisediminis]TWH80832.1 D-gamma-glutamyl-meso-diaminopimelic acid endopeptidase CwlS/peptidoglycan endopeptidase LytE [Cytobacillus oceanisediminis]